jgi:hypothetical protein
MALHDGGMMAFNEHCMRRDTALIRELLFRLESLPLNSGEIYNFGPDDKEVAIQGYSPDEIEYHLSLLREVGFIDCPGPQPMVGIWFSGLTWNGQEYLDAVRDPKRAEAARGLTVDEGPSIGAHSNARER